MQSDINRDAVWIEVCGLSDIVPNTGVTCLIGGRQIAVFRVGPADELYAIDARDPFSDAHVLGRGIVGCHRGRPKVASPMYKQSFCLQTGTCIDDASVTLDTFAVRAEEGKILVRAVVTRRLRSGNAPLLREGCA